jgi:signal transduction histidine kinase/DNA-binding NarL/FixJ family response regulator
VADAMSPTSGVSLGLQSLASAVIATGSTAQALTGGYLIERWIVGPDPFDRVANLVRFLGGVVAACLVACTVGVTSLALIGIMPWRDYPFSWWIWWTGDAVGVVSLTPLFLTWRRPIRIAWSALRIAEAATLFALLAAVSFAIFGGASVVRDIATPLPYLTLPFLVWGTFRFGRHGATLAVFVLSGIAIWGTIQGQGPFARDSLAGSLVSAQLFLGVVTIMTLAMVAVTTDRERAMEALRRAKAAADAANQAKGEFLAKVGHEIRTPICGILGMTELALTTSRDAQQRQYLQMAKASSDGLLVLMNDLLDYSRLETGRIELERVAFHWRAHLEDLLAPAALRAANKGVKLTFQPDRALPEVLVGDPGRIGQILMNLVDNAVKFTERGEVRIRVDSQSNGSSTAILHFAVHDTGIGIAPEEQAPIFAPFVQANGTASHKYGGAGLGLSIASELVQLLGGRIWLESELGRGSTFHFTAAVEIPAAEEIAAEEGALAEPGSIPTFGGPLRILLAEDNDINQILISHVLRRAGHEVTAVSNGREALEALTRSTYELVLMDVQMPEMNGYEATAAIRERERSSGGHIPIIAMTAFASRGDRERCLQAGMNGHVGKPLRVHDLWQALADAIPRKSTRAKGPTARRAAASLRAAASAAAKGKDILDRKDVLSRVNGDRRLLGRLVRQFCSDWRSMLEAARAAVGQGDPARAALTAHTLQGILGNLGAVRAADAAHEVERAAREGDLHGARESLHRLEAEIERLVPALAALLESPTDREAAAE